MLTATVEGQGSQGCYVLKVSEEELEERCIGDSDIIATQSYDKKETVVRGWSK
jgi:hypothetical protein